MSTTRRNDSFALENQADNQADNQVPPSAYSSSRLPEQKIMTMAEAIGWRIQMHSQGIKVVMTNGCFDILHRGHIAYLNLARREGGALLVAVNSDRSVRELKGPERPLNAQLDRAYLLGALECVDAVVIFDSLRVAPTMEAIVPDLYVKGGDVTIQTLPVEERDVLERFGIQFSSLPFIDGFSTTSIIAKAVKSREAPFPGHHFMSNTQAEASPSDPTGRT